MWFLIQNIVFIKMHLFPCLFAMLDWNAVATLFMFFSCSLCYDAFSRNNIFDVPLLFWFSCTDLKPFKSQKLSTSQHSNSFILDFSMIWWYSNQEAILDNICLVNWLIRTANFTFPLIYFTDNCWMQFLISN